MRADLVIAKHTRLVGCREEYKDSNLVYRQGNFLFDNSESEFWKIPLLIEADLDSKIVDFIPIKKIKTEQEKLIDTMQK